MCTWEKKKSSRVRLIQRVLTDASRKKRFLQNQVQGQMKKKKKKDKPGLDVGRGSSCREGRIYGSCAEPA